MGEEIKQKILSVLVTNTIFIYALHFVRNLIFDRKIKNSNYYHLRKDKLHRYVQLTKLLILVQLLYNLIDIVFNYILIQIIQLFEEINNKEGGLIHSILLK
jgi:hypothetical protein